METPNKLVVDVDESRTFGGTPYFQVAPVFGEICSLTVDLPDRTRLIVVKSHVTGNWSWMVTVPMTKVLASSEEDFTTAEEAIADFNGYVDSEFFCYED